MSYFAYLITFSRSDTTIYNFGSSRYRCGYIGMDEVYPYETSSQFSAKMFASIDDAIAIINKIRYKNTTYHIVGLKEELILDDEIEKIIRANVLKRAKTEFSEKELQILISELKE